MTDADPSPSTRITSISLSEAPASVDVLIQGTQPLTYTSVRQPLPLGVVLYFPETGLDNDAAEVPTTGHPVTSIQAGQVESTNNATRIEILLASDAPYNVVKEGNALRVRFEKTHAAAAASGQSQTTPLVAAPSVSATETPQSVQPVPFQSVKPSKTFQGTGAAVGTDNRLWVNRIDFLGEPDGRSTLSIETTGPADYDLR
ncbi:MAG: AMIN domain-containing protein, partial [Desulfosarcina sp.]